MNAGKTLFAQIMEFVPWKTFGRIIERHRGDAGVRTLGCAEVFRIMAFAQLTWHESLCDIETCMAANQDKLFHMGLRSSPARSTLADALNQALDRTQPGLPMKEGRAQTMTHDYKRCGTTTLFAALNTLDGTVMAACKERHRH